MLRPGGSGRRDRFEAFTYSPDELALRWQSSRTVGLCRAALRRGSGVVEVMKPTTVAGAVTVGRVARVCGFSTERAAGWLTPGQVVRFIGIGVDQLAGWSDAGWLSVRFDLSGVHRRYLRRELVEVAALGVGDSPPTLDRLVAFVQARERPASSAG